MDRKPTAAEGASSDVPEDLVRAADDYIDGCDVLVGVARAVEEAGWRGALTYDPVAEVKGLRVELLGYLEGLMGHARDGEDLAGVIGATYDRRFGELLDEAKKRCWEWIERFIRQAEEGRQFVYREKDALDKDLRSFFAVLRAYTLLCVRAKDCAGLLRAYNAGAFLETFYIDAEDDNCRAPFGRRRGGYALGLREYKEVGRGYRRLRRNTEREIKKIGNAAAQKLDEIKRKQGDARDGVKGR